jgi:hypothetical protein
MVNCGSVEDANKEITVKRRTHNLLTRFFAFYHNLLALMLLYRKH